MRRPARAFVRYWVALTAAWAAGLAGARADVALVIMPTSTPLS